MNRRSVAELWSSFLAQLPPDVLDRPDRLRLYRDLFYVGAFFVVTEILEQFDDATSTPEEDAAFLDAIEEELQMFGDDLLATTKRLSVH